MEQSRATRVNPPRASSGVALIFLLTFRLGRDDGIVHDVH